MAIHGLGSIAGSHTTGPASQRSTASTRRRESKHLSEGHARRSRRQHPKDDEHRPEPVDYSSPKCTSNQGPSENAQESCPCSIQAGAQVWQPPPQSPLL